MFKWNMTLVHSMPLANYQPLITIPDWDSIDQKVESILKDQTSFPDVEQYLKSL